MERAEISLENITFKFPSSIERLQGMTLKTIMKTQTNGCTKESLLSGGLFN